MGDLTARLSQPGSARSDAEYILPRDGCERRRCVVRLPLRPQTLQPRTPRLSGLGMAIFQRKQSNILLTFKVLQFVNQLRRRVKPRILDGSASLCQLGSDALGLRALKSISNGLPRIGGRHAKPLHHGPRRVCKSRNRKRTVKALGPSRAPASHVSAGSDAAGEEVQQYVWRSFSFGFAC